MSDLLSQLKLGTADKHVALENALGLGRPSLSRDEYIALLSAFRGFVTPWEAALAAVMPPSLQGFAQEREKTALLDADLQFLTGGALIPAALPTYSGSLRIESLASAIGSMYVMEGSTLGGRFIGPAMAARFGLEDRQGYAYFDPYGARTGSMWNAFKQTAVQALDQASCSRNGDGSELDQPDQLAAAYAEAVHAARATFDALYDWLPHRIDTTENTRESSRANTDAGAKADSATTIIRGSAGEERSSKEAA